MSEAKLGLVIVLTFAAAAIFGSLIMYANEGSELNGFTGRAIALQSNEEIGGSINSPVYKYSLYAVDSSGNAILSSTAESTLGCTWTDWKDRDNSDGTGDWETRADFADVCSTPAAIDCKTISGIDFRDAGQKVTCNTSLGSICRTSDNTAICQDYKVRFCCPTTSTINCTDTDRGYDYYTKGTLTWLIDGKRYINEDYCTKNMLTEYGCIGGKSVSNVTLCQYGCSNGACINYTKPTCYDSDGGKNYDTPGDVLGKLSAGGEDIRIYDSCTSMRDLKEMYCDPATSLIMNTSYTCPAGCVQDKRACAPTNNTIVITNENMTLTMRENSTVTFNNRIVTLVKIGTSALVISVNNTLMTINENSTKSISGIRVRVDRIYTEFNSYTNATKGYAATITLMKSIQCYTNSDCGLSTNTSTCSTDGRSVCTSTTTYTCNNPGTTSATCSGGGGGSCSPCTNGCSDGRCITIEYVPFTIGVESTASSASSDLINAQQLLRVLISNNLVSSTITIKSFREINGLDLDNKVTLAIYKNKAVLIIGKNSPENHYNFASVVSSSLYKYSGINATITSSSNINNANLLDLFIVPYCQDSDGGLNYNLKGTVNASNSALPKTDYCINSNYSSNNTESTKLGEYYCNGQIGSIQYYTCPTGTVCRNGACVLTTVTPPYFKKTVFMNEESTTDFLGKKVTLYRLSTSSGVMNVDGVLSVVYQNKTKSINGVIITLKDIFTRTTCSTNLYIKTCTRTPYAATVIMETPKVY